MQESALEFLSCPVCKGNLQLKVIKTKQKKFAPGGKYVIESGVLICSCNFLFPIIDCVPRMLIESFIEHERFLASNIPDFSQIKQLLCKEHKDLVHAAQKRNRRTKASFSFEWSMLNAREEINVWNLNKQEYKTQLFNELNLPEEFYENKLTIDVGCGHGRSTILLAEKCKTAFGIDLTPSVVKAEAENILENCHFIQADLHCPPFADNLFDIVYSSGVLHHTAHTENAFTIVSGLVHSRGVYCVWLYKPFGNSLHKTTTGLRKVTSLLPLRLQFWLYLIFLVPLYKFIMWLRGHKPRPWREIMIDLMDSFSPRYRFEHTPEEAKSWFTKNGFTDISITTINDIGFSMKAKRAEYQ
jgi:ubiquinone/menaquinone biosynthesis C-methylase UbiE/uncharacterized protein YbaR (Trm112 family)